MSYFTVIRRLSIRFSSAARNDAIGPKHRFLNVRCSAANGRIADIDPHQRRMTW